MNVYTCPKCGQQYKIEKPGEYSCACGEKFRVDIPEKGTCPFCLGAVDGGSSKCPHCGEWIKTPNRVYRLVVLKFADIDRQLAELSRDGWQIASQSTVFLSENAVGISGLFGATREEGIAVILYKTLPGDVPPPQDQPSTGPVPSGKMDWTLWLLLIFGVVAIVGLILWVILRR